MGLKGHARAGTAIGGIPVVCTDRGGDMTYHGPGQIVAYLLLDLARLGLGAKGLVRLLEQTVLDLLGEYGIGRSVAPARPACTSMAARSPRSGCACAAAAAITASRSMSTWTSRRSRISIPAGIRGWA